MRESFQDVLEQLTLVLNYLDAKSLLDICIITATFYLIYRTFRFSGGKRIFMGMLALGFLFAFARFINLRAINWIFINFRDVFIILLIILFQPEIRRMLERIMSFQVGKAGMSSQDFSEQITASLFELARNRTGAIVIFPGRESLSGHMDGGLEAGASFSDALVKSLFDPNSPGHDGAVLIENERIAQFGLRLPLARKTKLPASMGTRHHAAMGLAELTDALVIVVSEERGSVTVFQNGTHKVMRGIAELNATIRRFSRTISEPFLTRITGFVRTMPALLSSLLLACLVWTSIIFSEGRIREQTLKVAIETARRPPGLMVADQSHDFAVLKLAGTKQTLRKVNPESVRLRFNLESASPGPLVLRLRSRDLDLPSGVELIESSPAEVRFTVIAINEVQARIRPRLAGQAPAGYELEEIHLEPDSVAVYATRDSKKAGELFLYTTPIDLSRSHLHPVQKIRLRPAEGLKPVDGRWPEIKVEIILKEREPLPDALPEKLEKPEKGEKPAEEKPERKKPQSSATDS